MMQPSQFSLSAIIQIDGSPLPENLVPLLEVVVVDDHLHLPSMFLIAFRDREQKALADARLKIGAKVVISGLKLGGSTPQKLITGEVTSIEAEYDALGTRAVARGYDPSHRFHRGRNTETYRNVTDSDIVRKVAKRAGVQVGKVDSSRTTHVQVSQANVSDWEFLRGRARESGYQLEFVDGSLEFRKPAPASDAPSEGDYQSKDPLQLVMGDDLLEFRPRITSSEQVSEVEVRGWDVDKKKAMVGTAKAGTTSAKLTTNPGQLAGLFGSPRYLSGDRPYSSQSSVDEAAEAIAERIGSAFAEAIGVTFGNPDLRAGRPVSVSLVAKDFAGRYVPTSTRHVFDKEGYKTEFVVSGRQDRSLLGLASSAVGTGGSQGSPPLYGMVVATVTQNDDPDKLARVKLKFPWLPDQYESDWARVVQLGAGPNSGAVFLPEVGDEVLVAFEFGDVHRPYVVGGLYNGKDKPRLGDSLVKSGKVRRRGFVSRKGHRMILFDDDSKSGLALLTSDSKLRIALKETGSEIHVYGDGKIVIESTQGIEIKSKQSISIEASTQLTLKGSAGVKIESSSSVDIDGTPIQLN